MRSNRVFHALGAIGLATVLLPAGVDWINQEAHGADPQFVQVADELRAVEANQESILLLGAGDLEVYDVYPCGGDGIVELGDLLAMLDAYAGLYSCSCPAGAGLWNENGIDIYKTNLGEVGIGTTIPSMALHISGSDTSSSLTSFGGSPDCSLRLHNNDLTNNNFSSIAFTSRASNNAQFEVAKIAAVAVDHTSGATAGDLAFLTRGGGNMFERMRIQSTGNVGIGTTNPGTHRLQVTGDATELVQFNGTTDMVSGEDVLALEATAGSSATAQFIECFRSDIDFRVNLDGDVLADGTYSGPADFAEMIRVT